MVYKHKKCGTEIDIPDEVIAANPGIDCLYCPECGASFDINEFTTAQPQS